MTKKLKPTATLHGLTAWIEPVDFTDTQREQLTEICPDPAFVAAVREIAEDYRTHRQLVDKLNNPTEDRAALKRVVKAAQEARKKMDCLDALPARVPAYLYRSASAIATVRIQLTQIEADARQALTKIPTSGGRPGCGAERAAAQFLKAVFDQFQITWSQSTHGGAIRPTPAYVALTIVLETHRRPSPDSVIEHIKELSSGHRRRKKPPT